MLRADKGKLEDIISTVEIWEQLLHWYTDMKYLAVIILICVITIHPVFTSEGVPYIFSDSGCIIDEPFDQRRNISFGSNKLGSF